MHNQFKPIFTGTELPENSGNLCQIKGAKCNGNAIKTITLKNENYSGSINICDSGDCLARARENLTKGCKDLQRENGGRNEKHRRGH